jgi:lipopolysaccharide exporter
MRRRAPRVYASPPSCRLPPVRDLNRKMASGLLWLTLMRFSIRGLGLANTVILARLLVPKDFGLVAMAMSIIAMLELATSFNFDIVLIQNQGADRSHFDTAWTLNVLFYAGLTILLLLLAYPAAVFYEEEQLPPVIFALAVGFMARGFENIGIVHFRKEMNFRKDFIVQVSRKFIGFLVVVPLAFYLRSYWALVTGMVLGNALSTALTYVLQPFRPRFSLSAARELLGFSKWLLLNNGIMFLQVRSPNFIIGKLQGASALGLFNLAFDVATLSTTELVGPINRVVLPAYSKLSHDRKLLRDSYLDVLAVIALVAFPAGLGVSAIAHPLVDLLLGDKWAAAAPLVAVLAVFSGIQTLQANSGVVFNALGKPYLNTLLGVMNATLLLSASIPLAANLGSMGVAAAYLGTFALQAPLNFYFVCRETDVTAVDLLGVLWRPICATIVMYASVSYLAELLPHYDSLSTVLILALSGVVTFVAVALVLWSISGRPNSAEYRLASVVARKMRAWRVTESHGQY